MDDNLVTLVAVVVGGLIAAAAGWWQAHLQRRWQLEQMAGAFRIFAKIGFAVAAVVILALEVATVLKWQTYERH